MALTSVETADVLFVAEGSFVDEPTVTVFVASPASSPVTATVIGGAAPAASVSRVHVTVVEPAQFQPGPAADTSDAPVGRTSATVTDVAVEGPEFVTISA